MITVVPIGGLGNRMRVVDSSIALSKVTGQSLYVLWLLNPSLNCKFDELFILPVNIEQITYIATFSAYYKSLQPFRELAAIQTLQERIDTITVGFENVIGVHIRRADNLRSIEHSQTARFVELMETELAADRDTGFFLATDSPQEEAMFKGNFPGKIITYEKRALDRGDPRAARDALIDLYCLSRCRKLIGSYWSSFTNTAWQINGIDEVIVKVKDERLNSD